MSSTWPDAPGWCVKRKEEGTESETKGNSTNRGVETGPHKNDS